MAVLRWPLLTVEVDSYVYSKGAPVRVSGRAHPYRTVALVCYRSAWFGRKLRVVWRGWAGVEAETTRYEKTFHLREKTPEGQYVLEVVADGERSKAYFVIRWQV